MREEWPRLGVLNRWHVLPGLYTGVDGNGLVMKFVQGGQSVFIDLLKAYSYSPVNRTGSPQGLSQVQISHKLNTIQIMHIT